MYTSDILSQAMAKLFPHYSVAIILILFKLWDYKDKHMSCICSNFSQIGPLTTELAAFWRLFYRCPHFVFAAIYLIRFKLASYNEVHKILDEFEFWSDPTT